MGWFKPMVSSECLLVTHPWLQLGGKGILRFTSNGPFTLAYNAIPQPLFVSKVSLCS